MGVRSAALPDVSGISQTLAQLAATRAGASDTEEGLHAIVRCAAMNARRRSTTCGDCDDRSSSRSFAQAEQHLRVGRCLSGHDKLFRPYRSALGRRLQHARHDPPDFDQKRSFRWPNLGPLRCGRAAAGERSDGAQALETHRHIVGNRQSLEQVLLHQSGACSPPNFAEGIEELVKAVRLLLEKPL